MSDFDFLDHYGDSEEVKGEEQLDENEAVCRVPTQRNGAAR